MRGPKYRRGLRVASLCASLAIVEAAGAEELRLRSGGAASIDTRHAIDGAVIRRPNLNAFRGSSKADVGPSSFDDSSSQSRDASGKVLDGTVAAVTTPAARVRSTDARILELLKEGVERSATFRALVDAIGRSDGIIYVEFGPCAFGHLNGCLLPFIAALMTPAICGSL